jgi:predicted component of type VI protein secretion system
MSRIYVRVGHKTGLAQFFRCGICFVAAWTPHDNLDAATVERLKSEQMLEVTDSRPPELEETAAGDSAGVSTPPASVDAVPPVAAPEGDAALVVPVIDAGLTEAPVEAPAPAPVETPAPAPVETPAPAPKKGKK